MAGDGGNGGPNIKIYEEEKSSKEDKTYYLIFEHFDVVMLNEISVCIKRLQIYINKQVNREFVRLIA